LLKNFMVIFVFLLVWGTLTFFGSLREDINTIGSLGGTLTIEW
jgi:hypothetical protein